ncbi:MAG: hypothetical protein JWP97_5473 [Labilithrix sp.]|nr:hypothetical protein [Labilithrix sp.]
MKNIRRKSFDLSAVRLSPEEGFVLSRLDAPTSVRELVALTGLDEGRIVQIVERLASEGAVDLERDAPAAPPPPPAREEEDVSDAAAADAALEDDDEDDETAEDAERRLAGSREYQKIYETVFRPMTRDARAAAALEVDGERLMALCLDPEPQIVAAVLANPRSGMDHGRLIATHHRTQAGLDHVGRRSELVADAHVQRRLLANPQLPDSILRKIVGPKLLSDTYKIAVNREIPERSRVMTRELLQKKFMLASPDERAALLVRTEGRCLALLANCALDARTVQMLTSKTSYTVLFIQSFARWSATPPAILVHLLKQPVVRQNIGLRKQLLKHRNVPSEAKRNL